ncbi:MAG: hypothetical protein V3S29_00290 [bacterium]
MADLRPLLAFFRFESADALTAALIAAMLVARGLDFLSTWLVTPRLTLEANPLMRRLRWGRMGLLNLPLLGLPFLHHGLSVTFIVTSLLAAGGNLAHGALARGMGERKQLEAQKRALREIGLAGALALNSGGALVTALAGAFLMLLAGDAGALAWWGGLGVAMFGAAGLVHLNLAILRLGRRQN